MSQTFSPAFFKGNRRALLKNVDTKLIVITANAELQRSGDTAFRFRQDSNFWYLTGIDEPNYLLVITEKEEYIIKPNRHWVKDVFDGTIDDKALSKLSGVTQILDTRKGWQKLTKQLDKTKKVSTLFPMQDKHFNVTANPARRQAIMKMRRRVPALQMDDIRLEMARMRMIKQAPELVAIQQAIDATINTLKDTFSDKWEQRYSDEYELDADLSAGFRKHKADGNAFPSIVAAGQHACQIHHVKNKGPLKRGELLLLDLGAEVNNYSADLARTLSIGGAFSSRQSEIFDAVIEAQAFAFSLLKPGVLVRDYELTVEEHMGKVLKQLGVIKKLDRKNIRKFFPHATSHMMGLDTHDAADYSKPLQENMILAVEPGIYIPSEKIGIRIEDDVLITKTGIKVLSDNLPIRLGQTTI